MSKISSLRPAWLAPIWAAVATLLAGCSNMSALDAGSHYACKAPVGVACNSVSGTYANSVRNNLPSQRAQAVGAATPAPAYGTTSKNALVGITPLASATPQLAMVAEGALRSPPRVLRLWTQAWEDRDGDLHDQGYVYVQLDSGQWRIDHIRRQVRDPFRTVLAPPAVRGEAPDMTRQGQDAAQATSGESLVPGELQDPSRPATSPSRLPSLSPFTNPWQRERR